jgi:signal transduction histidine kinase
VRLEVSAKLVRLTVEDNGHGMTTNKHSEQSSLGMVGMRARARELGGELQVENGAAGGLRVQVEAPVAKPQDDNRQENTAIAG